MLLLPHKSLAEPLYLKSLTISFTFFSFAYLISPTKE